MITLYTANRVLRSKYHVPRNVTVFEFPDVCNHFLGPIGNTIAGIFGVLSFLGALLAYWVYMSTFLKSIGDFIHTMVICNAHKINIIETLTFKDHRPDAN